MALGYYKRFPRDFLEGTIGLDLETKGAYAIILDLIYMRDGRLPDDARFIAGQLGCSVRKWVSIRDRLVELGKLSLLGGFISNFRADYLLEETRKYQDKQAENGRQPKKNNDLTERSLNHPESEPEPEEDGGGGVGAREPDDWPDGDHVRLLVEAAMSPWLDPAKSHGLILTAGRLEGWRRRGASWQRHVIPVVTTLAKANGEPISSWQFFEKALGRAVKASRAELELPDGVVSLHATGPPRTIDEKSSASWDYAIAKIAKDEQS